MKLTAILHGIRVGWSHFRYPPVKNDPVAEPGYWAWATDNYTLALDLGKLPARGLRAAWFLGRSEEER